MNESDRLKWWERWALFICGGLLIGAAVCTGAFSKKADEKPKGDAANVTVTVTPPPTLPVPLPVPEPKLYPLKQERRIT